MKLVHAVWHAAELFTIRAALRPNESSTSARLLEWIAVNAVNADADAAAANALADTEAPERDESYWPLVRRLATRGHVQEAGSLLALHSAARADGNAARASDAELGAAVRALATLLSRVPTDATSRSFLSTRQAWRAECSVARERHRAVKSVGVLWDVVCGDENAIERECVDAFERLGAFAVFVAPQASPDDIDAAMRRWLPTGILREALLALLRGDAHAALLQLDGRSSESPDCWLAAHLSDLVRHAGLLESHALPHGGGDGGTRLRRAMLLRYAGALDAADADLALSWSVRCDYWSAAGPVGIEHALLRLARASLDSTRAAARVLSACARLGTPANGVASCVRACMGAKALRAGRAGDSVRWLVESGDQRWLAAAGNRLLSQQSSRRDDDVAASTRAEQLDAVLGALTDAHVFSGTLEFVAEYARLRELMRTKQVRGRFFCRLLALMCDATIV
jgi:hypothetical protein